MRRLLGFLVFAAAGLAAALAAGSDYPAVRPGLEIRFPADHGAHPDFRTEWWYVTGWVKAEDGRDFGFQVTFFRTRPPGGETNPSRFAPGQVLFAHAALSDSSAQRLLHGEQAARAGFGIANAAEGDAEVTLRGWQFRRDADGAFRTSASTPEFGLDLAFAPTQPPILQGEGGYSRKGPKPEEASAYYSIPHLRVSGTIVREGVSLPVSGEAWLDREWSSQYLAPGAVGWDWTGINLDDGSTLMAFRIRGKGAAALWAGGSFRRPDGRLTNFAPGDVTFATDRTWRSPRTGGAYPVAQTVTVRLPEGSRSFRLQPLFPDQELDSRASGLPVYWEGAVRTEGGRGYLELTGYAAKLEM